MQTLQSEEGHYGKITLLIVNCMDRSRNNKVILIIPCGIDRSQKEGRNVHTSEEGHYGKVTLLIVNCMDR